MMNLTQKTSEGRKIAQIVLPKIFYLYQQKIKRKKAKVIKEEKQKKYRKSFANFLENYGQNINIFLYLQINKNIN